MRPVNEKLRADLLEAGKREFMENGFRGASLKSIAASLGVTTGAIYRYYTDKEALFDGLVREPAQELVERYRTLQQTFAGRASCSTTPVSCAKNSKRAGSSDPARLP